MFQAVKASRGVANPNIGFICQARLVGLLGWGCWGAGRLQAVGGPARCLLWKFASARLINIMPPSCPPSVQLLQWHKRRHAPVDSCRLWRVAPQSTAAPQYLVAKAVAAPRPSSLDPRGAFVLQGPASTAVWLGAACPEPFAAAAHRFAQQLQRYEGAPGPALVVRQGQEPEVFWTSLAAATAEGSGSRAGSPAAPGSAAAAGAAAAAAELVAAAAAGPVAVAENSAYDKDFEVRSICSRHWFLVEPHCCSGSCVCCAANTAHCMPSLPAPARQLYARLQLAAAASAFYSACQPRLHGTGFPLRCSCMPVR